MKNTVKEYIDPEIKVIALAGEEDIITSSLDNENNDIEGEEV